MPATPATPTTAQPSSWNGIPLLKSAINFYKDMQFLTDIITDECIIVTYKGCWYTLANNGGEITIGKINTPEYVAEFPTVYFDRYLNPETLIYRLRSTLDGAAIDYAHREDNLLWIFQEDQKLVEKLSGTRFA